MKSPLTFILAGLAALGVTTATWSRAFPTNTATESAARPAPRHGVAAAYDPTTGRVVVFGGVNHLSAPELRYGDTWAWDGDRWRELSGSGPGPRIWPAAGIDQFSGAIILFGGLGPDRPLGDTWRFDGASWTRLAPRDSPPPRWHFAMATDERARQVVLFGGIDHTRTPARVFGDTWAWVSGSWRKMSEDGPSPRFGHAMAFDRRRQRVVLVGGRGEDQKPLGDSWAWNGSRWEPLEAAGLTPRVLHGVAFEESSETLLLFGGWNTEEGNYLGDTWRLDGRTWRRLEVSGPPPLRAHFMVSDLRRHRVVLFGGYTGGPGARNDRGGAVSNDVWEWDGRGWTRK